ncbi:GNAT family N-acetyltransferase [Inhella sp.]|uniref:GNAT family N-acetyltransferase n=1 Tax=Inhella sp. TaxID=1921806 RepID=UPI0035AFE386
MLDAEGARNPFATAAWLRPYLACCGRADGRYAAVGDAQRGWTLLEQQGGEWKALNNYYASLYSPWAGGTGTAAAADWPGAVVNLQPLDEASAARLEVQWRSQGWWTRRYDCFANWVLPCEGLGFADFMAQRPSQLVNTWKRKAKRFQRGDEGARLQIVDSLEGLDEGLLAYEAIYAKSWKQAEPYPGFIRAWARTCAERGWLRLGLAWVGEAPIAAQLWFTIERRAYIFKLAYDEAYKPWSAGTVLSALLFERALDRDQVVELDYLTGNDAYKSSWMTTCRQRFGVVACKPTHPAGLWRGTKEKLGAWTARWRCPAQAQSAVPVHDRESP